MRAFVARKALVPVLRKSRSKRFADGTGYLLRAGAPLSVVHRQIVPADSDLATFPVDLGEDDVALSFEASLPAEQLGADGEIMSCWSKTCGGTMSSFGPSREVGPAVWKDEHPEQKPDFWGNTWMDNVSLPCGIRSDSQDKTLLDGKPYTSSKFFDREQLFVHRIDGKRLLATLSQPFGELRVAVEPSMLQRFCGDGVGLGSIGSLGRRPGSAQKDPVKYVIRKSKVWYPDGAPAGELLEETAGFDPEVQGKRLCFATSLVDTRVCHDRKDAKKAPVK